MLTDKEIKKLEAENLETENTNLRARNIWLEDINQKIVVMIKNAADVLEEYVKSMEQLRVELEITQQIYSRLHRELTRTFDERQTDEHNT